MTDDPPYNPPPAPDRFALLRKFGITVLFLVAAWILLAYVLPRFVLPAPGKDMLQAPRQQARIAHEQIQALTERVNALEATLKTAGASGNDASDARVEALEDRLEALETSVAAEPRTLQETLDSQQQELTRLARATEALQAQNGQEMAVILAFRQLQDAVLRGDGFDRPLKELQSLIHQRQDTGDTLNQLASMGDDGVSTHEELAAMFEDAVPKALSPQAKPGSVLGALSSVVRVRKVGQAEGTDDTAVIARTEAALKERRIADSVTMLGELSPQAAAAFTAWKTEAQRHVLARDLLDALQIALAKKTMPAPTHEPVMPPTTAIEPEDALSAPAVSTEPVPEIMDPAPISPASNEAPPETVMEPAPELAPPPEPDEP